MNPDAGWYPDLANPGHERLWTGERWIAWIRPNRADRAEANPAGWRPDVGHPGFERLWSGEMWTDEIRRAGEAGSPGPGVTAPGGAGSATAAVPAGPGLAPAPSVRRHGALYHASSPPNKLARLGLWVQLSFGAMILAELAQLVANQRYIAVQSDLLAGRPPSLGHVESVVHTVHALTTVNLLIYAVTAILFIVWFFRAYRNLVRAGIGDLRHAPGWAIGCWFVPILAFFRPKQIANDIWKASASAATVGVEHRAELPLPASINWWWGTWILGGIVSFVGATKITNANDHRTYTLASLLGERTGVWFWQAALALMIVAAVLALLLVRQISTWQDAYFRTSPITSSDS